MPGERLLKSVGCCPRSTLVRRAMRRGRLRPTFPAHLVATSNGTWRSFAKRQDCTGFLDSLANYQLSPPSEEMSLDGGIPTDNIPKPRISRRDSTVWRWSALHIHTKTFAMAKGAAAIFIICPGLRCFWCLAEARRENDTETTTRARRCPCSSALLVRLRARGVRSRYMQDAPEGRRCTIINSVFRVVARKATIQLSTG